MKRHCLCVLLIVGAALLTSCSDDDGAATPSSPTAVPPESMTTSPPTTNQTVTTLAIATTPPSDAPSNSLTYVAEEDSVLAVIAARDNATRFLQLVDALGDDAAFRQERGVTLVVPVDSAWESYGDEEFAALLEDPNAVALMLSQHLSIGVFPVDELVATGFLSNALAIELPVIDATGSVTIGGATVLAADLTADNGVVHLIDMVLDS